MTFSNLADRAKGFAILLVVLGHIASPVSAFVFSFHVPLFFMLGGIFIKPQYSLGTYVTKGWKRLMIPFFLFGSLGMVATMLKDVLLHRPVEPILSSLSGLLLWMDEPHMHHYGFALWFLPALFWGRSIAFVALKSERVPPWVMLGIAVLAAWGVSRGIVLPFGLDKGIVALPWILAGYVFYIHREAWFASKFYGIGIVLLVVAILISSGHVGRLDLAMDKIGDPLYSFPYTWGMALVIFGLLGFAGQISQGWEEKVSDILGDFGRNSLLVLVVHVYTNNAADIAVKAIFGPGYWFLTFALSAAAVYAVIRLKVRHPEAYVFKYL